MKLTTNNIRRVRMIAIHGTPYSWSVIMKSGTVFDMRQYHNTDKFGRSTTDEYPLDKLPKAVQMFIENAEEVIESVDTWHGREYYHVVYK